MIRRPLGLCPFPALVLSCQISLLICSLLPPGARAIDPVTLDDKSKSSEVVLSNGIVTVTILNPLGDVLRISYGGKPNVLVEWPENYDPPVAPETASRSDAPTVGLPGGALTDRGYWNANFDSGSDTGIYDSFECDTYSVLNQTDDIVTLKFTRKFIPSDLPDTLEMLPVDVVVYYSLAAGDSGFYTWTVLEHPREYPSASMAELRFVLKLDPSFRWTALAKDRMRIMPEWLDRSQENSEPTAILEARKLITPSNPAFKNEIDCKYSYLMDIQDQLVYGWVSNDTLPVGIWLVNPYKYEYAPGGPTKQDLTVQTGPYLLNYLHSQHIGTPGVNLTFGVAWSKTYGPFKVYLNQQSRKSHQPEDDLYKDARTSAVAEYGKWPYAQFADPDHYPGQDQRGTVTGTLVTPKESGTDLSKIDLKRYGWVALAARDDAGSWAYETNNYQYWAHFKNRQTSQFEIKNVRPGQYILYAYIIGIYGDFRSKLLYTVTAGEHLELGTLEWSPPRAGPTIFELGVPDRDSAEFYVPVINSESSFPYAKPQANAYRNFGVWDAYARENPTSDPVYVVGKSDWSKDWWYIHAPRYSDSSNFSSGVPTVYTIQFNLPETPPPTHVFVLRLALAGKQRAGLQLYINNNDFESKPLMSTDTYAVDQYDANDNGMARLTSHGSYMHFDVGILGINFVNGTNNIYLRQEKTQSAYTYAAYDYIRLEGPGSSSS